MGVGVPFLESINPYVMDVILELDVMSCLVSMLSVILELDVISCLVAMFLLKMKIGNVTIKQARSLVLDFGSGDGYSDRVV